MSALPTAVLSGAKLVATPSHVSALALLAMVHSLVNALLLFRDGASHLAVGAALFPFLPAIATIVTIPLEVCILADTPVFPSQDMSFPISTISVAEDRKYWILDLRTSKFDAEVAERIAVIAIKFVVEIGFGQFKWRAMCGCGEFNYSQGGELIEDWQDI
ncbi:hypothetical protein LguiB_022412 [Lonicera macranthoides]